VLRFRFTNAEGRRVEHTFPVGLVSAFPKERDAWREVDRVGLGSGLTKLLQPDAFHFIFLRNTTSKRILE
jgi:hypothetical protein